MVAGPIWAYVLGILLALPIFALVLGLGVMVGRLFLQWLFPTEAGQKGNLKG